MTIIESFYFVVPLFGASCSIESLFSFSPIVIIYSASAFSPVFFF